MSPLIIFISHPAVALAGGRVDYTFVKVNQNLPLLQYCDQFRGEAIPVFNIGACVDIEILAFDPPPVEAHIYLYYFSQFPVRYQGS